MCVAGRGPRRKVQVQDSRSQVGPDWDCFWEGRGHGVRGHAVNNDSAIGGGHAVVNHGPTERVKGTDVEPIGTISTTVETTTLTAQGDTVTTTTRLAGALNR